MDKTHSTNRKNKRPLRSQQNSQNEPDTDENRSGMQKIPLRDKCCQTDHHHHGCCEPEHELEPGDPPLLQRPVQTSKSGIQQIIECFRSGTKQLKHILLKEVDTIFECRSCRSLFRGLPNLITHKQFYCLPSVNMDGGQPDENNKQNQAIRDLLEAIYPKADQQDYVINIEPIKTNPNALFQNVVKIDNPNKNSEGTRNSPEPDVQIQEPTTEPLELTPLTEVVVPQTVELTKKNSPISVSDEGHPNLLKPEEAIKTLSTPQQFTCSVCTKEFNSRRGIRRHVRRVHVRKLEEMKKCVEVQGKQINTTSKGTKKFIFKTQTTFCHECQKTFATKANVRRHIEEVHKGIRREPVIPDTPAKLEKYFHTEAISPKKTLKGFTPKKSALQDSSSLSSCQCPHCKRKYSSQVLLKKHLVIVHKTTLSEVNTKQQEKRSKTSKRSEVKTEATEAVKTREPPTLPSTPSPQKELMGVNHLNENINTSPAQKCKAISDSESAKSLIPSSSGGDQRCKKPKISAGFDFKQLYCRVCKRQFTSRQNLKKHIDLHTDGNTIFVKFYRCPICTYDTRRKRDVIRHITVVHKKSSRSLAKITANLEGRAIKKPIEFVLNKVTKRGPHGSEEKLISTKHDSSPASLSKTLEGADDGIEVKVTKSFALLRCNKCGKAFAKKTDLEQHKRATKSCASSSPDEIKSRSTRSKTLVCL